MLAYQINDGWVEWNRGMRPLDSSSDLYTLPANAENVYSDEELLRYGLYRVTIATPEPGEIVGSTITGEPPNPVLTYTVEPYSLDKLKEDKRIQAITIADNLLNTGAPVMLGETVLHVDVSNDGTRADLTAMATTAIGAQLSSSLPWPESYQLGWITFENIRIPLGTPEAGLLFAAQVGDYYARIVQRRRTLKDSIAAATTQAELDAIDINTGWPE